MSSAHKIPRHPHPRCGATSPLYKIPSPRGGGGIAYKIPSPLGGGGLGWGGRPHTPNTLSTPPRHPHPRCGATSPLYKIPSPLGGGGFAYKIPSPLGGGGLGWGGRPHTPNTLSTPPRHPHPRCGATSPLYKIPSPHGVGEKTKVPSPLGGGGLGWGLP